VIQSGVNASILPANNLGVQQCGGGGCPVPTTTGGGGCNPNNWALVGANYEVKILDVETDKPVYLPGEVVTITGTVQLLGQNVYMNECGDVQPGNAVKLSSNLVSITLSGPYGNPNVEKGQDFFSAQVTVPSDAKSGEVTYTVTATYQSVGDEKTVSFNVQTYSPTLVVTPSHSSWLGVGGFAYPGDEVAVSGSGWAPDGEVTLTCAELGLSQSVSVGSSGSFTVSVPVPGGQAEGPYTITGKELPNLEVPSNPFNVAWRTLTLILDTPAPAEQGSTASISGTVTDNDGKAVAGVSVTFAVQGLPAPSGASTDASGKFTSTIKVAEDAPIRSYTIQATAQKAPGYKPGSGSTTLQVTQQPLLNRIGKWLRQHAAGILGTLVALAGTVVATFVLSALESAIAGGSEGTVVVSTAVAAASAIAPVVAAAARAAEGGGSWIWHEVKHILFWHLLPHAIDWTLGAEPLQGGQPPPRQFPDGKARWHHRQRGGDSLLNY